jgi:hypothetical protein
MLPTNITQINILKWLTKDRIIIYPKLKAYGLALFPFIILRNKNDASDKVLMNHERIHLRQELELLVIPFYIFYGLNFLVNYFKYRSWSKSYYNIVFEREAHANENNLNYLKKRKPFNFIKYV